MVVVLLLLKFTSKLSDTASDAAELASYAHEQAQSSGENRIIVKEENLRWGSSPLTCPLCSIESHWDLTSAYC